MAPNATATYNNKVSLLRIDRAAKDNAEIYWARDNVWFTAIAINLILD